ncbi:major type 1 subunit fimbrin (pilin) [Acinetobacter calcoaceticus]|uniref:Major type 1 subunit fimbrin (Pilin) n=1 Tax=Acinetobacter calcoaceticus TaxID=471 RepID=A0A4R1XG65_ACICA|nr:major type 1 subunit fimbrin (pilin) [Acinetobacter calcoaceticus]
MLNILKVCAFILSAFTAQAFAADGTITINGKVIDNTCTLSSNGGPVVGSGNVTVTLATVKTSAFGATKGATQAKTDFQLRIIDSTSGGSCSSLASIGSVLISAVSSKYLPADSTALINDKAIDANSTGKKIYLQLLSGTTAIDFRAPRSIPQTAGIINLSTQYYQAEDGAVAAQNVSATVDYTLIYN